MYEEQLISVVIPVYNVEKYLNRCVDSVLNQSYSNIEIILVDDGSTDRSPLICDDYAEKYENIKVVHQIQSGVSCARNRGFEMTTGEYILFLDSDDYVEPEMFSTMISRMNETQSDAVVCGYQRVDENEEPIHNDSPVRGEVLDQYQIFRKMGEKNGWYYVMVGSRIVKKSICQNLSFLEGKLHEDEEYATRLYLKCGLIACVEDRFLNYRKTPGSIMNKKLSIAHLFYVDALYNRYLEVKKRGWLDLIPSLCTCAIGGIEYIHKISFNSEQDKKVRKETLRKFRRMVWDNWRQVPKKVLIISLFPNSYFRVKDAVKRQREDK